MASSPSHRTYRHGVVKPVVKAARLLAGCVLIPAASVTSTALQAQTNYTATVVVPPSLAVTGSSTLNPSVAGSSATNVNGAGTLTLDALAGPAPGDISITVTGAGLGLQVNTPGNASGLVLVPAGGLRIRTERGHAVMANGGRINIVGGVDIATSGVNTGGVGLPPAGAGLAALNAGVIDATDIRINHMTYGNTMSGFGAAAESGGSIVLRGAGTRITTSAREAVGLGASGAGSFVTVLDAAAQVTLNGAYSIGAYLHDGGQVLLPENFTLTLNGIGSSGVVIDRTSVDGVSGLGRNLTVSLTGTVPAPAPLSNNAGTGLTVVNGGSATLQGFRVRGADTGIGVWVISGASPSFSPPPGGTGLSVQVNLTGADIEVSAIKSGVTTRVLNTGADLVTTSGTGAFTASTSTPSVGLKATAGSGATAAASSSITAIDSQVLVSTANGVGAAAGTNVASGLNTVSLVRSTVTTTGASSVGVQAHANGRITADASRITTSGGNAAVWIQPTSFGPASADFNNTTILAQGTTEGLYVPGTPTMVGVPQVRLSGGSLLSEAGTAIDVEGPLRFNAGNGALVTGGGGNLLETYTMFGGAPAATVVDLSASGSSALTGDIVTTAPGHTVNLSLAGSRWTGGALSVTGATLDAGSTWNVTRDSVVTQALNNGGTVAFVAPTGTPGRTLTVRDYLGQPGSVLGLHTHMGTDGSPSDRLVVNGGTATGNSGLRITDAGGGGALTLGNGILVVDAIAGGTTGPGGFRLAQPAVAGIYEYRLYRGSVDGSDAQDWYLRSEAMPPPPPPTPPPPPPPSPPSPPSPPAPPPPAPIPLLRPEIGSYLANQRLAAGMFLHSLHDRLGEPQWIETQDVDRTGEDKPDSPWLRVVDKTTRSRSNTGIADIDLQVDTRSALIHGGMDIARWSTDGTDRWQWGGMLGYGWGSSDATARYNPRSADSSVRGLSLGGYATWYENNAQRLGWYFDGWGQLGWFKNKVQGQDLPQVKYDSRVLTLSAEAGRAGRIRDGSDWMIEPQAQLVWMDYQGKDFTEPGGTRIEGGKGSGWVARLGVRLHRTWVHNDGKRTQPYVTLNWWHDEAANEVRFNAVPMRNLWPGDRYELKLGVNAERGNGWSGWGLIAVQWGSQDFRGFTARAGIKRTW